MNVYKTIVLGASGSGKTVFLASMFNKLSVQHREIGFYLTTTPEHQIYLMDKFREVETTSRGWPSGTKRADFSEYVFDCKVNTPKGEFHVFRFSYLDYAGGLLTDSPEEGASYGINDIKKEVDNAHAILVLIDGHKLWQALENKDTDAQSNFSISQDLRFILPNIMQCLNVPIHFVITKWDLIKGSYTLAEARQKLMENSYFKSIVNLRKDRGKPTRLIPVSSVGDEFAKLGKNGIVEKIAGKTPKPDMVEMPLACVLFDLYEFAKQDRDVLVKSKGYQIRLLFLRILRGLGFVGALSLSLLQWPTGALIGRDVALAVTELLTNQVSRGVAYVNKKHQDYANTIQGSADAMEHAIRCYWILNHKLVDKYPDSELV